jgi:replicative DNA helicase
MTKEQARAELLTREPDFLNQAKQKVNGQPTYICPVCGNGKGKDGDGIALNVNSKSDFPHWHCFGCGLEADILELWMKYNQISDYAVAFRTAYEHYGIMIDSNSAPIQAHTSPQNSLRILSSKTISSETESPSRGVQGLKSVSEEPEPDYTDFFLQANKNLLNTDYHRGISLDTLNRFNVGYVEHWQSPKALREGKNPPTSPRLIIPTSKHSYIARDTRGNLTDGQKKFSKMKAGNVNIFNISALWNADKPVFIVEGEIDAMSICDVGGEAVGIGSTSMIGKLIETLRNAQQKPAQPLIIALDNDKAGQETTAKLSEELDKLDISYFVYNIAEPYKDANEALNADRDMLTDKVEEIQNDPEEAIRMAQEAEYMQTSVLSHVDEFVNGIAESVNTPYIPTKFKILDTVLDGGLYEGLYFIGAISSLGKTTFAMQMCDQIADSGHDVLIFSLEMARAELMAKSISRLTFLDVIQSGGDTRNAKTARGITTGSRYAKYSQTEKDLIQRSITAYKRFAGNIFIHQGIGDIGTEQVRATVEKHISITGRKPVILIDYLQILAPADVRATDKQNTDKAVIELKRISRDFKIPVIGISSFNRENYAYPVSMQSFKESGAIEYSSDVLIGLQLHGTGTKNFDATKEKAKNPRDIELVILKNRNGTTGKKIQYNYHPMFNYFHEIGEIKDANGQGLTIGKTSGKSKGLVKIR